MGQTYLIVEGKNEIRHIICGHCLSVSYNENDIANKYCGRCHIYHETPLSIPKPTDPLNDTEKKFVALALQGLALRLGPTGFPLAVIIAGKLGISHQLQELLRDFLKFAREEEHELRNR